jgi:2-methylcitrate dehydratase PrpD
MRCSRWVAHAVSASSDAASNTARGFGGMENLLDNNRGDYARFSRDAWPRTN